MSEASRLGDASRPEIHFPQMTVLGSTPQEPRFLLWFCTRPEAQCSHTGILGLDVHSSVLLVKYKVGKLFATLRDIVDAKVMGAHSDHIARAGERGDMMMA